MHLHLNVRFDVIKTELICFLNEYGGVNLRVLLLPNLINEFDCIMHTICNCGKAHY